MNNYICLKMLPPGQLADSLSQMGLCPLLETPEDCPLGSGGVAGDVDCICRDCILAWLHSEAPMD